MIQDGVAYGGPNLDLLIGKILRKDTVAESLSRPGFKHCNGTKEEISPAEPQGQERSRNDVRAEFLLKEEANMR